MLTKSAKRIMAAIFAMPNGTQLHDYFIPVKTRNNNTRYMQPDRDNWPAVNSFHFNVNPASGTGISVGTGNTAATDDDYSLESGIPDYTLSGYVSVLNVSMVNDYPCVELLVSVTNLSGSAFTIAEIGYFVQVMAKVAGSSSGGTMVVMADRTVLNSPVTVPAGETKNIKYTLTGQWT